DMVDGDYAIPCVCLTHFGLRPNLGDPNPQRQQASPALFAIGAPPQPFGETPTTPADGASPALVAVGAPPQPFGETPTTPADGASPALVAIGAPPQPPRLVRA